MRHFNAPFRSRYAPADAAAPPSRHAAAVYATLTVLMLVFRCRRADVAAIALRY